MAMAEESSLVVSSSTDPMQAVESAAQGTSEGVSVSESSLADFRESESSDGQTTTSYESPGSERNALLERLSEAEREIELLPEEPADQQGQAVDESGLNAKERELIRQQAVQDALQDARQHRQAYYEQQTQQHFSPAQAELNELTSQLEANFTEKLAAIKDVDLKKLARDAEREGTDISLPVRDALICLEGGEKAMVFLLQHAEERRRLARLPEHVQVAEIGRLSARLTTPPRRAVSAAPLPISPVGGSATKSSRDLGEMSYSDYRAAREREIKSRRGR